MVHKKALITGGSSGLGLALAKLLAEEGYSLFLLARNAERLEQAKGQIGEKVVQTFPASITDQEALEKVAEELRKRGEQLDFLILNAGIVYVQTLWESEVEKLKEVVEVNLWGTILSAKVFLPFVSSGGRILLISSAFGLLGGAGYSTYCATKAGIVNFGESLRRELLSRNIRVYVACPADIDTPQYREEVAQSPEWLKLEKGRGSLLTPEEAAKRILRKCSGDSFLILINGEIQLLQFLSRFLPLRWKNWLLDRILPRP